MIITINGVERNANLDGTGNRGADIQRAARKICKDAGICWESAAIFAQHGECGRCYIKQPGFTQMGAHG